MTEQTRQEVERALLACGIPLDAMYDRHKQAAAVVDALAPIVERIERERDDMRGERHALEARLFSVLHPATDHKDDANVEELAHVVVAELTALRATLEQQKQNALTVVEQWKAEANENAQLRATLAAREQQVQGVRDWLNRTRNVCLRESVPVATALAEFDALEPVARLAASEAK